MLRLETAGTNWFDFKRDNGTGALSIQGSQVGNIYIAICPTWPRRHRGFLSYFLTLSNWYQCGCGAAHCMLY